MAKVNKIKVPQMSNSYEEQGQFLKEIKKLVNDDSIIILDFSNCKTVTSRVLGGVIYPWKTKKARIKFERVSKELAKDFKLILPERVVDVFGFEDNPDQ